MCAEAGIAAVLHILELDSGTMAILAIYINNSFDTKHELWGIQVSSKLPKKKGGT